jgi:20S proteasome subunit beta 7
LAIKYKDGIMMAADNLGGFHYCSPRAWLTLCYSASYGSLARFKDIQRLHAVGNNTIIGAGGDMSDFQYIQNMLDELMIDEFTAQDGDVLGPAEIHEYLSQVLYARRTKMNPLWNSILVGGFKDGQRYVLLWLSNVCLTGLQVLGLCRPVGNDLLRVDTGYWLRIIHRPAPA